MAVPSMLMVAPSGSTNEVTSFDMPIFSVHSMLMGSVPTDEADANAKPITGISPFRNLSGFMRAKILMMPEYTRRICTIMAT